MHTNLYRIDDWLLRSGGIALGLVAAAAALVVLFGLAEGAPGQADPGLAALARWGGWLALALLCPVALLTAGFVVRRRERRVLAIWRLLRQHPVLSARDLVANSDHNRRDLLHAVRFLNTHGVAHYVWDRESDTIRDGRLRGSTVFVEKCEGCGANLSLEIAIASAELPRCPYCEDPIDAEGLAERRAEEIDALREPPRAPGADAPKHFSPLVFFLLLCAFWPAALGYAWWAWRRDLAERARADAEPDLRVTA